MPKLTGPAGPSGPVLTGLPPLKEVGTSPSVE
jgi:hypothetical protein